MRCNSISENKINYPHEVVSIIDKYNLKIFDSSNDFTNSMTDGVVLDKSGKIISLRITRAQITDISFLSTFSDVVDLDLSCNNIQNIEVLNKLSIMGFKIKKQMIVAEMYRVGNLQRINKYE